MVAERTTAAERMAPMADVVMMGVMLGLGRVGGGSGWRQCQATEVGSREEGEGEAAMGKQAR